MVWEDWRLEERDWDVDNDDFIVPYNRDVNNADSAEESETESASESENDDVDDETLMEHWEVMMNLMIRIGDTISRALSPTPE